MRRTPRHRTITSTLILGLVVGLIGLRLMPAHAASSDRDAGTGVRLLSPSDWPTERQGGVLKPIPMERYLSGKFGRVEEQLTALEQRITALEQVAQQSQADRKALEAKLQAWESRERSTSPATR